MGAQAAALLDAGGPVGEVPSSVTTTGSLQLAAPTPYDLDRVARGHGGVGLAPSAYDGTRLHRVLRLPAGEAAVVVSPDLRVTWSGAADAAEVRRQLGVVLALDDDLGALWDACDRLPSLSWVRAVGAGRVLRSPSAWEDLVGTLAATNTSYAATRRRVGALVTGAFPTPERVARLGEDGLRAAGWGYRAAALRRLAEGIGNGLDVEAWRGGDLDDEQVLARLRALPGFGPFAAATALPLMGHRPRPLVLDGWLRQQVPDIERFRVLGRWAGTGLWLEVTAARGRTRPLPDGSVGRGGGSPTWRGSPPPPRRRR